MKRLLEHQARLTGQLIRLTLGRCCDHHLAGDDAPGEFVAGGADGIKNELRLDAVLGAGLLDRGGEGFGRGGLRYGNNTLRVIGQA